jgi:hypothetical protein
VQQNTAAAGRSPCAMRPWWGTPANFSASGQSAADTPPAPISPSRPSSSLASDHGLPDASPASGARHDRKEWQAHWAAFGEVELQASADSRESMRAVCKIQHGVLTMSIPPPTSGLQVPPPPKGTASTAFAASGPYSTLSVGVSPTDIKANMRYTRNSTKVFSTSLRRSSHSESTSL